MRFLIDAQLPPMLASWLVDQGFEAAHVVDCGLGAASDAAIAERARCDDAVLMSKDEDFMTLRLPDRFALVWLRVGNATNRALLAWIETRWPTVVGLLHAGERFIEVR